jgi:hypothetical protein
MLGILPGFKTGLSGYHIKRSSMIEVIDFCRKTNKLRDFDDVSALHIFEVNNKFFYKMEFFKFYLYSSNLFSSNIIIFFAFMVKFKLISTF